MPGVVFAESSNIEPRDADVWLSPEVGGMAPATAAEVVEVAQRQLRLVRSLCRGATGKTLTVLRVGVTGIAKRSVPLLIGEQRGCELRRLFRRQRTGCAVDGPRPGLAAARLPDPASAGRDGRGSPVCCPQPRMSTAC
jgi:hypothetical protein